MLSKARPSTVMASFSFPLQNRVTQMSYGVDKRGRVNFLAKTADEGFNQFHAVRMFPFPDALAQFRAAKDAARLAHQHAQQCEFSRRKLDPARSPVQCSLRQVQNQIVDLKLDWRRFRKTSPKRTYSRDQLLHGERLCEVIIRPLSGASYAIAHLATRSQDQDTSVHLSPAQTSQHFEAIHPGQHHIEHDEIVMRSLGFAQGSFAVV